MVSLLQDDRVALSMFGGVPWLTTMWFMPTCSLCWLVLVSSVLVDMVRSEVQMSVAAAFVCVSLLRNVLVV